MHSYVGLALAMWLIKMQLGHSWVRSAPRRTMKRITGPVQKLCGAGRTLMSRHLSSKALDDEDEDADLDAKVQATYDKVLGIRTIVSESNEKVKLVKNLQLKKRRDKEGLILLEGHRQVIDALRYGAVPRNIFMTERGINGPMGYSLMEAITFYNEAAIKDSTSREDDLFRKIDLVSDTIMKKCFSDVENAQGVVAAFKRPDRASYLRANKTSQGAEDGSNNNSNSALVVFLDHLSDPGNMGTLIRSSFGFGVDAMILTGGCDPWAPKVIRSAMGMGLQVPIIETAGWSDQLIDILEDPSPQQMGTLYPPLGHADQDFQILVADLDEKASPYYEMDFTKPTLLIVGSEARGPSVEVTSLPNAKRVFIPMLRDLESLNAAVAGSVILSEAARQRK